jgi:hypothetical protein
VHWEVQEFQLGPALEDATGYTVVSRIRWQVPSYGESDHSSDYCQCVEQLADRSIYEPADQNRRLRSYQNLLRFLPVRSAREFFWHFISDVSGGLTKIASAGRECVELLLVRCVMQAAAKDH